MDALTLTGNDPGKEEMEYHAKFGHTILWIKNMDITRRIVICCIYCGLGTQNMAPNLPGFQGIKRCIKYIDSHYHKPIFNPSNYYDVSNLIRIKRSEYQVEDYKTHNCIELHQDQDHAIILNRRWPFSGIIHNIIDIVLLWKINIQPAVEFEPSDVEIICIYKAVDKTTAIRGNTELLEIHTDAPKVHLEDSTSCIYFVEYKIVTHRVKHIDITVCFLK